ncbi:MAG: hypothetical protein LUD47_07910 [Clostridia bacterium]|nr:hypothetical protein [Clostridia bacterium]
MLIDAYMVPLMDIADYNADEDGDAYLEFKEKIIDTDEMVAMGTYCINEYCGKKSVLIPVVQLEDGEKYGLAADWDEFKEMLGIKSMRWSLPYSGYGPESN